MNKKYSKKVFILRMMHVLCDLRGLNENVSRFPCFPPFSSIPVVVRSLKKRYNYHTRNPGSYPLFSDMEQT
jgi:hypothetical protein